MEERPGQIQQDKGKVKIIKTREQGKYNKNKEMKQKVMLQRGKWILEAMWTISSDRHKNYKQVS